MEEVDKDADLRHPSINTEPRTLNENSIERATAAAQKIHAQHPEPTSDCFTKDAIDSATRDNAPAEDAADALGTKLDGSISNAGDVINTNFNQSNSPVQTGCPPAAASLQESST